jgi:uncharacterized protein YecE (DUF72 family)
MHPARLGLCGWSYKDWAGVFYPKGTKAADYLAHVAGRYPVVEVDTTFYRSPSRKTGEGWRDRTPAGFGFHSRSRSPSPTRRCFWAVRTR